MKKMFYAAVITGLIFSCTQKMASTKMHQAKTYSSLKKQNIKGAVRMIEQRRFSVNSQNNALTEDTCCLERNLFDKKGLNIKRENINSKGVINSTVVHTFYNNGLYKKIENLNKDGKVVYHEEFRLDSAGNYEGGTAFDQDGKVTRHFKILKQSEFGSWSLLEWYTPEMKLIQTQVSTFDGNKVLKQVWENADGKIARLQEGEFNERGDLVTSMVSTQERGKDSLTVTKSRLRYDEYDKYGNWTQRSSLNTDGKVSRVSKRSITYW